MEGRGPGPDRAGTAPAQVHPGAVQERLLQCDHQHRGVQLSQGGAHLQEGVLLLSHHHLRPLLYVGHRLLGLILAGPTRHPRPGVAGRHHPADHVHPDQRDLRPAAARVLHQGYRRVDRRLSGQRAESSDKTNIEPSSQLGEHHSLILTTSKNLPADECLHFQGFVFCALLEFALVNYASR